MSEVGVLEGLDGVFTLKPKRLKKRHIDLMRKSALDAAVLVGAVPEDDIGKNHPFGKVIAERHPRIFKEGRKLLPMPQESLGQLLQMTVAVIP